MANRAVVDELADMLIRLETLSGPELTPLLAAVAAVRNGKHKPKALAAQARR